MNGIIEDLPDYPEAEKNELCQELIKNVGTMAGLVFTMCKIPNYITGNAYFDNYTLEITITRKPPKVDIG